VTAIKVSVIIPVRNEEKYISAAIDSIILGSYPHEQLEIIVVDGRSTDKSREIIEEYEKQHSFIKLLDNVEQTVPYAMNIGIKHACGEVIVRMDAHTIYPVDYISRLVHSLVELNADNVGGSSKYVPANDSLEARAVALISSHPFGIGNSQYRRGTAEIKEVDTVPYGCYRRDIFDKIGLYDEILTRNQDDELNARLRKHGGKIYLIPGVQLTSFARETISKMGKMLFQYGYFKPLVNIKIGWPPATLRQLIPPLFVLSLFVSLVGSFIFYQLFYLFAAVVFLHSVANFIVSFFLAKKNGLRLLPFLFYGFFMAHFAYGFGYLKGILDFNLLKKNEKINKINLSISR
jgi:glycosyltransferase involved in cell wall biosynthesis